MHCLNAYVFSILAIAAFRRFPGLPDPTVIVNVGSFRNICCANSSSTVVLDTSSEGGASRVGFETIRLSFAVNKINVIPN